MIASRAREPCYGIVSFLGPPLPIAYVFSPYVLARFIFSKELHTVGKVMKSDFNVQQRKSAK